MMIACELCRVKSTSENGYSTWPGSTGKAKFLHQVIDSILHEDDSGMPVMQDKIAFWEMLLHITIEASEWTQLCTILLNSHGKKMILACEWCRAKSTSDKWQVHKTRKHSKKHNCAALHEFKWHKMILACEWPKAKSTWHDQEALNMTWLWGIYAAPNTPTGIQCNDKTGEWNVITRRAQFISQHKSFIYSWWKKSVTGGNTNTLEKIHITDTNSESTEHSFHVDKTSKAMLGDPANPTTSCTTDDFTYLSQCENLCNHRDHPFIQVLVQVWPCTQTPRVLRYDAPSRATTPTHSSYLPHILFLHTLPSIWVWGNPKSTGKSCHSHIIKVWQLKTT